MGCWRCDVKWEDKVEEVPMQGRKYFGGNKVDEYKYVEEIQRGKCEKCGKLYCRKVTRL